MLKALAVLHPSQSRLDHLAVIEAGAKSANGKRHSTAEVKRALGI